MEVFVNNSAVNIFRGAKIIDAVRTYQQDLAKALEEGRLSAYDHRGHMVQWNGPMEEGDKITLR